MRVWQEIKIAEHELSDLMDELSPVVDVGGLCKHGWVEVVPGRQLPWFASERREKRGLK